MRNADPAPGFTARAALIVALAWMLAAFPKTPGQVPRRT